MALFDVVRKRVRTILCAGRSVMIVPTTTTIGARLYLRIIEGSLTRVQLRCNKTFRHFLRAPKLAIGAVEFHTFTSEP